MLSPKRIVLSSLYYPSKFLGYFDSLIRKRTRVRVILMHDVPDEDLQKFEDIINFLQKSWNFISAEEFANHLNGIKELEGDNILLTFDDGFRSNRKVAEIVLDPKGIKALFFVATGFIKANGPKEYSEFITNSLYPEWRNHILPSNLDKMRGLTVADLKFLIDEGHTIGCHTESHPDLSQVNNLSELKKEIIDSGDFLAKELNTEINHFSFGFGNISFFSEAALKIALDRYPYIYTGMRGDNGYIKNQWAIRRDTIDLDDNLMMIGSFTEGIVDFRYKNAFIEYESWGLNYTNDQI
ncbi:MAG: polysaccharide deacetylase family protein [Gammaproteobacteria bacterium]|nr:polysaccharide deacetylase family protein [Gammaproteobacteria bacterium]